MDLDPHNTLGSWSTWRLRNWDPGQAKIFKKKYRIPVLGLVKPKLFCGVGALGTGNEVARYFDSDSRASKPKYFCSIICKFVQPLSSYFCHL